VDDKQRLTPADIPQELIDWHVRDASVSNSWAESLAARLNKAIELGVVARPKPAYSTGERYAYLEIEPCRYDPEGVAREPMMEVCEPDEAEFWTLCGRTHEGLAEALSDFGTKEAAERVRRLLGWGEDDPNTEKAKLWT
jgi:hypothetical protein